MAVSIAARAKFGDLPGAVRWRSEMVSTQTTPDVMAYTVGCSLHNSSDVRTSGPQKHHPDCETGWFGRCAVSTSPLNNIEHTFIDGQ